MEKLELDRQRSLRRRSSAKGETRDVAKDPTSHDPEAASTCKVTTDARSSWDWHIALARSATLPQKAFQEDSVAEDGRNSLIHKQSASDLEAAEALPTLLCGGSGGKCRGRSSSSLSSRGHEAAVSLPSAERSSSRRSSDRSSSKQQSLRSGEARGRDTSLKVGANSPHSSPSRSGTRSRSSSRSSANTERAELTAEQLDEVLWDLFREYCQAPRIFARQL
eukprot:TRINITY_DN14264_c0_g1_i2.p1 TRINITY_DN14264_c0_g1~~TRINITY_DN14264_c0_g1_i2.p1  ORF type:complete len:221 (+),score=42.98 TRINITY_DN14264_c0_g1_i2:347-1009(+)